MTIPGVGDPQPPTFDASSRKAAAGQLTKMIQNLGNLLTNFKALQSRLSDVSFGLGRNVDATTIADGKKLLKQIKTIQNELSSLDAGGALKYAMGRNKANAFVKKIGEGLRNAKTSIQTAVDNATTAKVDSSAGSLLGDLVNASYALDDIVKVSYS